MKTRFNAEIKFRTTTKQRERLLVEAEMAGKADLSDYLRELLDHHHDAVHVRQVLGQLDLALEKLRPLLQSGPSSPLMQSLARLERLEVLMEELAMHASPQIPQRANQRLRAAAEGGVQ